MNILASSSSLIFFSWFLCLQIYYALWGHFLNWLFKSLIWCIFFYLIPPFGFLAVSFFFFPLPKHIFSTPFPEQLAFCFKCCSSLVSIEILFIIFLQSLMFFFINSVSVWAVSFDWGIVCLQYVWSSFSSVFFSFLNFILFFYTAGSY